MEKTWLSIKEVGEYLGVSRATVYRWVKDGKLKIHKVGRVSRVKKNDLDKLMEGGGV